MKYPYLETKFKESIDNETINLINKYWKINNGIFQNTPTDLRMELGISQPKLNSIIKENSETNLFLGECVECKNPIYINVTSQSTAISKIENIHYQCSSCRNALNEELKKVEFTSHKLHRLQYALKFRYWNKLNREELSVLKKIIEYNDYRTLQSEFIQKNFKHYWPIVERLDKLALIDIQKEPIYNRNIETIYFLPELAEELEVNPIDNVIIESSLNFHLPKRLIRTKDTQPNFFKKIIFDKNIQIKAGAEYFCSVWFNSDGSINFGMKPISELNAQNDGTKNFEPKSIGELIAKMRENQ